MWHFLTLCYKLWHSVTLWDTLLLFVTLCDTFQDPYSLDCFYFKGIQSVFRTFYFRLLCVTKDHIRLDKYLIYHPLFLVCDILWLFNSLWHFDTLCDTLLHYVTLCDTLWHFVTLCDKMWHFPTPLQSRQGMHNIDCEAVFLSPFNVFSDILSFLSHVKNQQRNFSFKIPSWRSETDF